MMVVHLLIGILSALLAAVAALILGHSILEAIAAYAVGGAFGILVSGLGIVLLRSRPPRQIVHPDRSVAQPARARTTS